MKTDEVLKTWKALNDVLRSAKEPACRVLLDAELDGKRRLMFLLRIHSRINKVRADQERSELKKKARS